MSHAHVGNVVPFEKPSASVVHVTPEIAERWLGKNKVNRNVRNAKVAQYARDMSNGNWQITGEAIKFSQEGRLLDGQHRLLAIVESGATVAMFVVRGLDPDTQNVMDSGSSRSTGDTLQFDGHKNANILASVSRQALRMTLGGESWSYQPTRTEIREWVDANPDAVIAADIASRYARHTDIIPSIVGLTAWMIGTVAGYDSADEFWSSAATKIELRRGDPVIALTNAFAENRRKQRALDVRAQVSAIIRAYNARAVGKSMSIIKFVSPGGGGKHVAIPRVQA